MVAPAARLPQSVSVDALLTTAPSPRQGRVGCGMIATTATLTGSQGAP